MTRLGVLLSGRGSNFEAIANSIDRGDLAAEIAVVISNKSDAAGLMSAQRRGLTAVNLPSKGVAREAYDELLIGTLREHRAEWVVLAGYLRLLTPEFIRAFPQRIVNIHPSLLPAFPGLHAQRQALDYGVRVSGCTVHLVDEKLDHGPIILQAAVPVEAGDSEETLSQRILVQEHRIYSEALRLLIERPFRLDGRTLRFD